MEYCVTLDILRHGECQDGHVFRGSTDVELTSDGFSHMYDVCQQANTQWDTIVTSGLKRCLYFARHLSKQNLVSMQIDNKVKELHFGDWEGQPIAEVWQNDTNNIETWMKDPSQFTPNNGEPIALFFERVVKAYQQMIQQNKDTHLLLVTHGGVIRCLLAHILGLPFTHLNIFDVPYASISQVKIFVSPKGNITKIMHINGLKP